MKFNQHSNLKGQHAFLSASNYHWLNYSPERLIEVYRNQQLAELGTRKHEFAKEAICLGQKLPKTHATLCEYVNDAIGYKMTPEQMLFYSNMCFGTADTISFNKDFLRIHDLKTGTNEAKFQQLYIYAALFCLEYGIDPREIGIELRIYQNDDVRIETPDQQVIRDVIDIIISDNDILMKQKEEEES